MYNIHHNTDSCDKNSSQSPYQKHHARTHTHIMPNVMEKHRNCRDEN